MSFIGKSLANYSIISLIGKGSMGEAYQAKDQKFGRDVAIKATLWKRSLTGVRNYPSGYYS
jgi:hypothetical protein